MPLFPPAWTYRETLDQSFSNARWAGGIKEGLPPGAVRVSMSPRQSATSKTIRSRFR